MTSRPKAQGKQAPEAQTTPAEDTYKLRLYVAGTSPKSLVALANLKRICEENLQGHYHLEVIDILENPQLAAGDQILAIPTLVSCRRRSARSSAIFPIPTACWWAWTSSPGK